MTDEITISHEYVGHKFTNANLAEATRLIAQESSNMHASMLRTCGALSMLREQLTTDDFKREGFADVWDYAYRVFGIKTPTARRMEAVGRAFIIDGKCKLGENVTWSYASLVKLLPIKDEALRLVATGKVTSDMTAAEVGEVVAQVKPKGKRRGNTAKHAATLTLLAVGPCIVTDGKKRGVSLDGGRTMAYVLDGLTDNATRNRLYKDVRNMLDGLQK